MFNMNKLGFNQKNFNGTRPVTNVAVNLGATRGKGSSTRMFNYCTQTSSSPSLCINSFITVAATPVNEDILFDLSSFNDLFDYDNSGIPKKLPNRYINSLIYAANRWNNYIKFQQETINLIRSLNISYKNWKGIKLENVLYIDTPTIAAAAGANVGIYTTLNVSFNLKLNDVILSTYDDSLLDNVITHELGHALGFSSWSSRADGKENGAIYLPYYITNIAYNNNPVCTISPPYKNMNIGYNNYWGTIDWLNRKVDSTTTPITYTVNGVHLIPGYFGSIEEPPQPSTRANKYIKRGFGNEIMLPQFTINRKYYISQVSLGYLLDIFTNWKGRNYYNYNIKNSNGEVTSFNEPRPGSDPADFVIYFNTKKEINLKTTTENSEKNIEIDKSTIVFTCGCCNI